MNDKNSYLFPTSSQTRFCYRLDVVVEGKIILELKSCEKVEEIYKAQLLTYLRLSGLKLGLILNFNVPIMKQGIVRVVNNLEE
jgi:GxxExxY protein